MIELPFCQQVIELNTNLQSTQEPENKYCWPFDLKEKNVILLLILRYQLCVFAGAETYASVSRPLPVYDNWWGWFSDKRDTRMLHVLLSHKTKGG